MRSRLLDSLPSADLWWAALVPTFCVASVCLPVEWRALLDGGCHFLKLGISPGLCVRAVCAVLRVYLAL